MELFRQNKGSHHKSIQEGFKKLDRKLRLEFKFLGKYAAAFEKYTMPVYYRKMNTALRNGTVESLDGTLKTTIKNLRGAFRIGRINGRKLHRKLKGYRKTLYRATGKLPYVPQVGATIRDKAFTSTSKEQSVAHDFLNEADASESTISVRVHQAFQWCSS